MSGLLLVGLSDPEAGAVEILLGRRWPGAGALRIPRGPQLALPEQSAEARRCDACMIDLASVGLRQRSADAESRLLAFLDGRPAIILSRELEGSWLDHPLAAAEGQPIIVLKTPYGSTQLLAGMAQILASMQPPAATAPASAVRPAAAANGDAGPVPAWRRALELAERLNQPLANGGGATPPVAANGAGQPATARVPTSRTRPSARGIGLRQGALPALLKVFPELRAQPMIQFGERILAGGEAVLLQFNKDVAFVACVRCGWLASGIRIPMLLRMLNDWPRLDLVSIQPLTAAEAEVVVGERFGHLQHRMRHPLDTLCWDFAAARLNGLTLRPQGPLRLRLKRLPNFTRLGAVGPLDLQLAALAARIPQSLAELTRRFPGREQEVYRFAVLSLLSGVAEVMPETGSTALPAAAADARRRGFFKSLLDRLF